MARQVTVNLFDVKWTTPRSQQLSQTLMEYAGLPLEQRWRDDVRLDQVSRQDADINLAFEAYHLDFAKRRDIGPGKLGDTTAVADVGLRANEFFGEETAALFLPRKRWLLVLNNHYGVGPTRMAGYFNALDPGDADRHFDYEVQPKIDSEALQKMRAMRHFSNIEITANIAAFEEADDSLGESVSDVAREARAYRVHLKLEANAVHKKGNVLNPGPIRALIDKLMSANEGVDKLQVKGGSEAADQKDQVIDLIQQKIRRTYPETELDVRNHRYTYESKIKILRRACRGWLETIG